MPYVPTLGVVGPGCASADLFHAVLDVADTGGFLPWDKDRRWLSEKDERVLAGEIVHGPDRTLIPALSLRGRGSVKVYCYGPDPREAEIMEWARKLAMVFGVHSGARLLWCNGQSEESKARLMLKELSHSDARDHDGVTELRDCTVADTFTAFVDAASQAGEPGFAFLMSRMSQCEDGPVLVAVEDRRIVGAVGPLSTMADAQGVRHQPPQYFTVLPEYRGWGHGRRLWQASMGWGWAHGARYKVLQAASGSAAETLYLSEGLSSLGFVHELRL
ncbi:GNAT family N-acetyltransferase [Actinomadura hibisca]|uniref:GNAT family N-acetyltransferase n=1 Tax=Actinomadura hibisca TaxID=68565 RepID=UPI000B1AB17D|nr:GNAT family N-acetyltransferase [Actinomadura hibisca]